MSDYIDTREGWTEVSSTAYAAFRGPRLREDPSPDDNGLSRYWVREAPVPPLPTVPYTVIRATVHLYGSNRDDVIVLDADGSWYSLTSEVPWDADDLSCITSFEVLAEPRAVTAKALIDRVRYEMRSDQAPHVAAALDVIAHDFGVGS